MTTAPVDYSGIERYLTVLALHNATDLHLTAGAPPLLRIDGKLVPLDEPALDGPHVDRLVLGLLDGELLDRFHREKEIDFSFSWREQIRFRANVFRQQGTVALALRAIPFDIPTFDELGLPADHGVLRGAAPGPPARDRARPARASRRRWRR